MNDDFLNELHDDPRPEFARQLRERLRDEAEAAEAARRRWRPLVSLVAVAATLAIAFTFPAVRASAQAVLDLFRVRNFTAVSFDPARFERLRSAGNDRMMGIFDHQQVLHDPGPPQSVRSFAEASAAAGIDARQPSLLSGGVALDSLWVTGAGEASLTVHAGELRSLLDALELRDVEIPAGLDGQSVHVSTSPIVTARYASGSRRVMFVQARSPEVGLPSGTDPVRLGEIGLRVLGLSEDEAHRLASRIDWRNTLVVPVPINAASFREVTVGDNRGLLVNTHRAPQGAGTNGEDGVREGRLLLWSTPDRVFALSGTLDSVELLQMAESVR